MQCDLRFSTAGVEGTEELEWQYFTSELRDDISCQYSTFKLKWSPHSCTKRTSSRKSVEEGSEAPVNWAIFNDTRTAA